MKNNKRLEIIIVIALSILCLTGILFAVRTSRDTGDEVLPQEGTEIKSTVSTEVSTEEETETVEEQTEPTEVVEETTEEETEAIEETEITIEKGEPISEKDLEFPFFGYETYIEYIKAGNDYSVYMVADNAKMIETGNFVDEGDVVESTVRGIKLDDNIQKILEVYGPADLYDTYGRNCFSHDGREDVEEYCYFFNSEEAPNYSYTFRFIVDQYGDLIGFILEPIKIS